MPTLKPPSGRATTLPTYGWTPATSERPKARNDPLNQGLSRPVTSRDVRWSTSAHPPYPRGLCPRRYFPPKGVGLRDWPDGSWLVSGVGGDDGGWGLSVVPFALVGSVVVVVGEVAVEVVS